MKKGFASAIIIICIVVVFVLVGIAYHFGPTPQDNNNSSVKPLIPTDLQSKDFLPYNQLSNDTTSGEVETFTDNILGVDFTFPKKYYSQSFKADGKNLYAGLFFLEKINRANEKNISSAVDCELNNRKDPAGICREGMVGDLEVSISIPVNIPNIDEDEASVADTCEKEAINREKILYSCLTQLSVNPEDKGTRYTLYLTADKPRLITVTTQNPLKFSELIRNIVISAKVLP